MTKEEAQPIISEERVAEDRQPSPILSDPEDLFVIVSFKTHIAMSIWIGEV